MWSTLFFGGEFDGMFGVTFFLTKANEEEGVFFAGTQMDEDDLEGFTLMKIPDMDEDLLPPPPPSSGRARIKVNSLGGFSKPAMKSPLQHAARLSDSDSSSPSLSPAHSPITEYKGDGRIPLLLEPLLSAPSATPGASSVTFTNLSSPVYVPTRSRISPSFAPVPNRVLPLIDPTLPANLSTLTLNPRPSSFVTVEVTTAFLSSSSSPASPVTSVDTQSPIILSDSLDHGLDLDLPPNLLANSRGDDYLPSSIERPILRHPLARPTAAASSQSLRPQSSPSILRSASDLNAASMSLGSPVPSSSSPPRMPRPFVKTQSGLEKSEIENIKPRRDRFVQQKKFFSLKKIWILFIYVISVSTKKSSI
jgi:hypothetical protein